MGIQRYAAPELCQCLSTLKQRSLLQLAIKYLPKPDRQRLIDQLPVAVNRKIEIRRTLQCLLTWHETHYSLIGPPTLCFMPFVHWNSTMDAIDYQVCTVITVKLSWPRDAITADCSDLSESYGNFFGRGILTPIRLSRSRKQF